MTKWSSGFAILFCAVSIGQLRAEEQNSFVTVEKVCVTPFKGGQFEVELKATCTLGANDTFVDQKCWFTDPNGKEFIPDSKFTPPPAGKSCNFTVKFTTGTKGAWQGGNVSMEYKTAKGFKGVASACTQFDVQ